MSELDVIVIGGGPAGAAAGRLLAAWGHSVLVLTKAIDEARGLAESLPPSTRKLLAAVGVLEAVEAAGFYRTTGNTVWWASDDGRVETFQQTGASGEAREVAGYQVFRPAFDRLLIAQAEAAGARVVIGASVKQVGAYDADDSDGADNAGASSAMSSVQFEHDGRTVTSSARFVLDCSGRAGVIARQGYRRYEAGHRMQALIGIWERGPAGHGPAGHGPGEHGPSDHGWDLPDDTQTLVETYEDGWAWSVPLSPSTRHVGAMVNGETTKLTRGREIAEVYKSELAKTRQLASRMRTSDAGARLRHVWACDASLYSARTYADAARQWLLVGDAGAFIDPLSSFGVKKALASAWIAAVAVHTSLRDAGRKVIALDFFSAWERQVYTTHLQQTRDFARRAYAQHPSAFWAARAEAIDRDELSDLADQATIEQTLMRDPGVRNALDAFKQSPSLQLAWADSIRFEKRPLIRDREIVLEDAVPLPVARTCLRYLGGVDLLKLGEMACQHRQVPDLYEAYCRTQPPVSLPHLLGGLSLLVANGVLTDRSRIR
jgi:flavin-dependent dehydrogenase